MCTKITKEIAVATICETYGLKADEFSTLLEIFGCITPEQRNHILMISTVWAAKDMMDNKIMT